MSFSSPDETIWDEFGDKSLSEDTNSLDGAGGDDLAIYSEDDLTQLTGLFYKATDNQSSYPTAPGVCDVEPIEWEESPLTSHASGLKACSEDADSTVGESEMMSVWFADREQKKELAKSATANAAVQELVPGFFNVNDAWNEFGELSLGYGFPGHGLAPDGRPLAGNVQLYADGDPVGGADATGNFMTAVAPPDGWGIIDGHDGSGLPDTFTTEYVPDADAIPLTREDESWPRPSFLDVAYSAIAGVVSDIDGDPVDGALIEVPAYDRGASTNADGIYELFAPQGEKQELAALDGTVTAQAQPAALETVYVNFQFGGIKVEVRDAAGSPVENAPVEWNDTEYRTDETGNVRIKEAPIDTHELTIFDAKTVEVAVGEQGHLATHREQGEGASLKIVVRDDQTGRRIAETKAIDLTQESITYTNEDGELRSVAIADVAEDPDTHEFDVVVGVDDPRYRTKRVTIQPEVDESYLEETIRLEPDVTITRH